MFICDIIKDCIVHNIIQLRRWITEISNQNQRNYVSYHIGITLTLLNRYDLIRFDSIFA